MSLDFDYKDVDEKFWKNPATGERTVLANTMPFVCMAVGIPVITEANVKDFYERVKLWEKLYGTFLKSDEGDRPITSHDIRNMIGLRTNVSGISKSTFVKNTTQNFFREVSRGI